MFRIFQQLFIISILWFMLAAGVFWLHPQSAGLFSGGQAVVPQVEGEISLAEAKRLTSEGRALWVDVRPAAEFVQGHVPGAESVPADEPGVLEAKLFEWTRAGTLGPASTVVVYCASAGCGTSHQLREQLIGMNTGLNVVVLAGGWAEWQRGERAALP